MDFQISDSKYNEALEWLYIQLPMFSRIGAAAYKPGLETTLKLDRLYGQPHKKFKTIHIGGTNGKGSTSHMIAAALQAQGYKTGLYTSPHLTDFRERIRINGKMIPKDNVVGFVEDWKKKDSLIKPSFFELTMVMAFDWFASQKVDYAVIEVGMGGRLDSTNVINPAISVITNISFDHTQFLGDTLDKIAKEKAGIIKRRIPVVIGQASPDILQIFKAKASEMQSPLYFAPDFKGVEILNHSENGWDCRLSGGTTFTVPLAGHYQKENILTAICAINVLRDAGIVISDSNIARGLTEVNILTGLRGRWQKVNDVPVVICDTGHNKAGISESLSTIRNFYKDKTIRYILGFVNDKDIDSIVSLFPKESKYYFTQASVPRAMEAGKVADIFRGQSINGNIFPTVMEAYKAALAEASASDIIYIGGSTFVVADFLANR